MALSLVTKAAGIGTSATARRHIQRISILNIMHKKLAAAASQLVVFPSRNACCGTGAADRFAQNGKDSVWDDRMSIVQYSAKRFKLGCVNSTPRPEGDHAT